MHTWRKTGIALAAAGVLAAATFATPQPAQAHGPGGGAVAAGVIGGLAAGALVGAAVANGPYYGPGYYGPAPVYYGPHCWIERHRVWDGWGWHIERVRVCH